MLKKHTKKIEDIVKNHHFRVAIFGSARIKQHDGLYQDVFKLAQQIGRRGIDVVTGGGPGLMEAANAGHQMGDKEDVADTIGLTIQLPWEAEENRHLDIKKHFQHFSQRLDQFMVLSHVVVVTPGGVGTCLEFFYTWQLTQVKHICRIPIILIGEMWGDLVEWVKKFPLKDGLVSPEDLDNVFVVKDNAEALKIIDRAHHLYREDGGNYCQNAKLYKID